MKRKQQTEDIALYVEHRQPTQEEERLFRQFMQQRQETTKDVKKSLQPKPLKTLLNPAIQA